MGSVAGTVRGVGRAAAAVDVSHFAAVDAVAHLRHAQAQELYNLRVFLLVNNHFGRRREARERLRHLGRRARRASLARATSGKQFLRESKPQLQD